MQMLNRETANVRNSKEHLDPLCSHGFAAGTTALGHHLGHLLHDCRIYILTCTIAHATLLHVMPCIELHTLRYMSHADFTGYSTICGPSACNAFARPATLAHHHTSAQHCSLNQLFSMHITTNETTSLFRQSVRHQTPAQLPLTVCQR